MHCMLLRPLPVLLSFRLFLRAEAVLSQGVDPVRKQEHRELLQQDDARFKRGKYLWLYNVENTPDAAQERFLQIRQEFEDDTAWGDEGIIA